MKLHLSFRLTEKFGTGVTLPADISDEDAKSAAMASKSIAIILDGKEPKKIVVVPKKLINIVL